MIEVRYRVEIGDSVKSITEEEALELRDELIAALVDTNK